MQTLQYEVVQVQSSPRQNLVTKLRRGHNVKTNEETIKYAQIS